MANAQAKQTAKEPRTARILMFDATPAQVSFLFDLSNWALVLGGFLVFVGTFGSITMGAKKDFFSDQRISENETETARAQESAAIAAERASEADARAAEANQKAESERLERLKLGERIAPRSLTFEQKLATMTLMMPMSGSRVVVISYALDVEGAVLASQLVDCLKSAGLNTTVRIVSMMPLGGFSAGVHVSGSNQSLVKRLRDVLGQAGGLVVASNDAKQGMAPWARSEPNGALAATNLPMLYRTYHAA
jgi:hypothetical protein